MTETISFGVPGMTCGHCQASIEREVTGIAGVENVEVDLDLKTVSVTGTNLDRDIIVAAIDEAGFDVD